MTCPNCSTKTTGRYCHECGQKTGEARYTFKGILTDLFYDAIQLENKSLPKTIFRLTKEPGTAIREVILGKRQSLYPPFKFLALIGAVVILLSLRYRFFLNEYTQVQTNQTHILFGLIFIPEAYRAFLENFFRFAEENATLLNIAAIPVFTFLSFVLLSRNAYNFAENLVLNTYITGQQLFFLLLLIPFFEFVPDHKTMLITLYTLGVTAYNFLVYIQFFGYRLANVFKSAAVVVLGYLCQFPFNFLLFYLHRHYIDPYLDWLPKNF